MTTQNAPVVQDADNDVDELDAALSAKQTGEQSVDADDDSGEEGDADGGEDSKESSDAGEETVNTDADDATKDKEADNTADSGNRDADKENVALRQTLREMKRQQALMQEKLNRLEALEDDGDDADAGVSKGKLNELTTALNQVTQTKGPVLETLLEAMKLNPQYSDIDDVCSRANFDDIFEAAADHIAAEYGMSKEEAVIVAETEVWSMPNPYKYMYDIIKQYHPKYKTPEVPKEKEGEKSVATPPKGKQKPSNAPGSVNNMGGTDSKQSSTWTAKRIDEMDETSEEFAKIPSEIYQKYLAGELD